MVRKNEIIYKGSWRSRLGLPALSLTAAFLSWLMASVGEQWAWGGVYLFGLIGIMTLFEVFRGVGVLRVNDQEFSYNTMFRSRKIRWSQVDQVEIQKVGRKDILVCNLNNNSRLLITEKFGEEPESLLRIFTKRL